MRAARRPHRSLLQILSAANLEEQPLLIAMRMSDGNKFNVRHSCRLRLLLLARAHADLQALLPKMDASHAQVFKQAAATFANVDVPLGAPRQRMCHLGFAC